jgi:hypothetical protein
MACTQPGCTGAIIDGYCDVCGSPANAAPFVAAESAASAESPHPADGPGPTAVRPESGVRPETKNEDLNMGCTQPGCIGTIVDCYCNVCGSPADASPFVTAEAAASATTPPADEPGVTAVLAPTPAPAAVEEEMPTQLISRVSVPSEQVSAQDVVEPGVADPAVVEEEMPTQLISRVSVPSEQVSAQEVVEPGVADPAALAAQKVDGDKEVAESQPNGAQEYRTRVEEAKMPHGVREAALGEVGKLEQTSDYGSESGDIRTWLDTILDLPWSGKTTDWIDIQESRDVEATLRRLIEPAAAAVEEGATAEVGLVAADIEKADTAADVENAVAEIGPAAVDTEEADTAEIEPVAADIEKADTAADIENAVAEIGPAAVDIEEADTAEIEPVAADIEKADTAADVENAEAEIGPAAAGLEQGDTAGVEPVAADIEKADTAADVENAEAEIGPAAAGLEQGDTAGVEPVAADLEKADTAPVGPEHDDTVKMPAVPAVSSGGRLQRPQLPGQQVLEPEPVQTPAKKKRFGYLALAATVLAALLIGAFLFAASRDRGVTTQSTATATATVIKPTSEPSNESTDTGGEEPTIQLEDLPDSARSFQTVRVEGTYRGGPDTFVQVQRWEGGQWLAFPYAAKTDNLGRFTAFVELGQPGRYRLRVLDREDPDVRSRTFVLVITR